jgi:hypothetical protein
LRAFGIGPSTEARSPRGLSFSNGGNCHATFDLKDGHVTKILYSGEKNATLAPDAYCAPILRTCMGQLEQAKRGAAPHGGG